MKKKKNLPEKKKDPRSDPVHDEQLQKAPFGSLATRDTHV